MFLWGVRQFGGPEILTMSSVEEGNLRVEKLTAENFHNWKFDMKMLLMRNDVWDIVTGEEVLENGASIVKRTAFKKRENRALSTICLAVSKECKIYVRSAKTSREAWETLEKHFEEKTLSRKIMYRQKLYWLRMEDENMVEHINKLKTIAEHLEALDDAPPERELVMILLSSLPKAYHNLITTLETLDEEKLTWEYVRDRVITEYERKKGDEVKSKRKGPEDALFVGGESGGGSGGGGKKFGGGNKNKKFTCHYCHETGHFIRDCTKKKEAEKKAQEKAEEENASFCKTTNKMSKMNLSDSCEDFTPLFALHVNDTKNEEKKWLLDSACSKHLTGIRKDLVNFKKFVREDEFEYVTLADNSVVKAEGKGNVNLYLCDENGVKVPVTFKDVLFVPKLERLISISQLTENKDEDVVVSFKNKCAILEIKGRRFNFGRKIGKLYKMNYCYFAANHQKKKDRPS